MGGIFDSVVLSFKKSIVAVRKKFSVKYLYWRVVNVEFYVLITFRHMCGVQLETICFGFYMHTL